MVDDDGDGEPAVLPELRPERTRVVSAPGGWGRAHACRTGAAVAEGDVIHWLDADMVPEREEVARQMRWHHLVDHAVVLGHKYFLQPDGLASVAAVHDAVARDALPELFAGRWSEEHDWVEEIWRRTDDLRTAGFRAFHVHVGATASVTRALYDDAGGMDPSLKLGEDVELGYRLAMRGAVFVPDRSATSWHLGPSNLMRHGDAVQRYNAPFVAQRVPDFRKFRQDRGRSYRVPLIEAVVEAEGQPFERTKFTVDGVLRGLPADKQCLLVAPWSTLDEERRDLLDDPVLDLRLLREEYAADVRVSFVEKIEASGFPAQFRLHIPVGWRPGETTLDDLAHDMQLRTQGLRSVMLPDGQVVRLEHTAAFERARRVAAPGEDLDTAVDTVSETWWSEGLEVGFEPYDPARGPVHAGVRRRRRQATLASGGGARPRSAAAQPQARVRAALRRRGGRGGVAR